MSDFNVKLCQLFTLVQNCGLPRQAFSEILPILLLEKVQKWLVTLSHNDWLTGQQGEK